MMKKLVGNVVSVLMEVLMWITFVGCIIGGLYFGYSNLGAAGAAIGLVLGAIAGILLNTVWWFFSTFQEIRDYSKKWREKAGGLPEPSFQRLSIPIDGRKIIISLLLVALLAGIAAIAKNFTGSDASKKEEKAAYKEEAKKEADRQEAKEPPALGFKTVKMPDGKIWMAENLNVETGNSSCYDDEPANCLKCGRLYDWAAAVNACPDGWHLPSDAEWIALGNAAGSGTALRSKSGWNNGNGTDDYGFAALPCGRYYDGKFLHHGALAFFWTATGSDSKNALGSALDANNPNLDIGKISKFYRRSVRCLKD